MEPQEERDLDRLLNDVRLPSAPPGFEQRVMARLREERESSFFSRCALWWREQSFGFQGGLAAACAALFIAAGAAGLWQWKEQKETDQVLAALEAFEQFQQDQAKWSELDLYTSQ